MAMVASAAAQKRVGREEAAGMMTSTAVEIEPVTGAETTSTAVVPDAPSVTSSRDVVQTIAASGIVIAGAVATTIGMTTGMIGMTTTTATVGATSATATDRRFVDRVRAIPYTADSGAAIKATVSADMDMTTGTGSGVARATSTSRLAGAAVPWVDPCLKTSWVMSCSGASTGAQGILTGEDRSMADGTATTSFVSTWAISQLHGS